MSFPLDADAEPFRQSVFDDDPGIGCGTGCDDDVDGDDVDGPQVDVPVGGQARAGTEKDGMDQVDGIRVVTQEGEDLVDPLRDRPAFPPVEEEEHRRQGIGHADRAELMDSEDCRQGVVAQVVHDAVVGGQHTRCRRCLEDVDQRAVAFQPVRHGCEVFGRKGTEHEDEQVVQDDVVQAEVEGVLDEGIVGMDRPDVAGIEVEDHVGEKEDSKREPRRLVHEAQERPPQRHEEVEPQEDDQEVNVIHGQAVP